MTRNRDLFRRIADTIEANPDLYDQTAYGSPTSCGTAHCIAGHAAAISGCQPNDWGMWSTVRAPGREELRDTHDVAAELLGLNAEEADDLFNGSWEPPAGQTVAEAFRAIGDGARIMPTEEDDHD